MCHFGNIYDFVCFLLLFFNDLHLCDICKQRMWVPVPNVYLVLFVCLFTVDETSSCLVVCVIVYSYNLS